MTHSQTYALSPISKEQHDILELVRIGGNINIDAVAGSGKTTTSLYIAKNNPHRQILLLTYNAKLKLETREKAKQLGLSNIEIHSYHAFCVKYFYPKAMKDSGILKFLNLKKRPAPLKPFLYNIIIVDEAQDMNPTYYQLVLHIIKTLDDYRPQLIIMGDRKQSIYAFNKADNRFLVNSPQIYSGIWTNATLSTSYRITKQMADFLNNCCLGSLPIRAIKSGPPVRYIICESYGSKPFYEIRRYLEAGYQFEDIFILAPSVRSEQSPVRKLANTLTSHSLPIYVPTNDEERLDEDILKGKIVFSTFHQVKGLERKVVLVFNFDNGYFEYYDKDSDPNVIPNTMYVAATRAKEQLTIIHGEDKEYCPFIVTTTLSRTVYLEVSAKFDRIPSNKRNKESKKVGKETAVTELVKYVPVDILEKCRKLLTITPVSLPKSKRLDIPLKTKQDELYEGVAEITGTAIPCYYELLTTKHMTIFRHIQTNVMVSMRSKNIGSQPRCLIVDSDDESYQSMDIYSNILESLTTEPLLRLTTEWTSLKTGFNFKKSQIKKYDWLSKEVLLESVERLDAIIDKSKKLEFEIPLQFQFEGLFIIGFADLYEDNRNLWELKVVGEIDTEHFLQLAIYIWLFNQHKKPVENSYVYNIMTNQSYKVSASMENLNNIVKTLVDHKNNGLERKSDQQFLEGCSEIYSKVFS
jgi:hypothetical protein